MPASLPESFSTIAAEALLSTLPAEPASVSARTEGNYLKNKNFCFKI